MKKLFRTAGTLSSKHELKSGKMKTINSILLCAGTLAVLCACEVCDAATNDFSQAEISEPADARVYTEDGVLVVALAGNPTTGYEWTCAADGDCLSVGEREYVQNPADEEMVGVGGVFVFRFTPKSAGSETLRFSYARCWEKEPIQRIEYVVSVSGTEGNFSVAWRQN